MSTTRLLTPDAHFLSAHNPTATADQVALESLAIELMQTPQVQSGMAEAAQRWKTVVGRDITAESLARFDELVEEYAFNYVLKAANSDANHPRLLAHLYGPPHRWFGMQVPGSRGTGGDGPDQNYTIVPVDGYARFELQVRRLDPAIGDVPFTLTGNLSLTMTLGSLDWQDVVFDADDCFTLTLDPQPANGRRNHIRTTLESRYLFIRDCRADWRQTPNAYRFRRLDPPAAPPLTREQIAERAMRYMVDDVTAMYWFPRVFAGLEINTITPPFKTGTVGGLVSQMISFARISLQDDEALVITSGSGNAPFRNIVLHDMWFRTLDYWNRTSNLNNAQGAPNADGSTTYVVSLADPGVHNWLDPAGLHDTLLVHRWQGLKRDAGPDGTPWSRSRLVKLKDLDAALPPGMRRITPAERAQQIAERQQTFQLRYRTD